MSFFLGIDLGTSYFKVGVFDENGTLCGLGRQAVIKNNNGAVCEVEVPAFWETLRGCIAKAVKEAQVTPYDITALSYSSQANSFILLDEAGEPLTPLILWSDERVMETPEPLARLMEKTDFLERTGLGIKPGIQSMVAKIDWIQRKEAHIWRKAKHILSISDYLIFSLTGKKIGDLSTSSMTGLLDVPNHAWWKEALDLFEIKETHLSLPVKTGTRIGKLTPKGTELTGLSRDTTLFSGGLDHHMVAVGAGLPHFDYISESTGTVLACVNYTTGYHPRKGVNIAPGLDTNRYFQMAFSANGAVALEWYQAKFASKHTIPDLLGLAKEVEPGCEGLTARPRANEYEWPNGFTDVKEYHSHGHFVRAILESTSSSLSELVNEVDPVNKIRAIVPSGGGAQSRLWLQIKANLTNKVFLLPESGELACKGAALLCAVGMSRFSSMEEAIKHQVRTKEVIKPDPVEAEKYKERAYQMNN